MSECRSNNCENCTCGRRYGGSRSVCDFAANANFAPIERPKRLVRRDPFKAVDSIAKRFEETLNILS